MTDSKTQDVEASSGDEPVDIEEQRAESIPEEQTGRFSGNELNESGQWTSFSAERDVEQVSGNEIDEKLDDKGLESVTEASGEEFSDIHVDELDEFNELEEEKRHSVQDEKPPETITGVLIGKKRTGLLTALVLCFLVGIGYFFMKAEKSPVDPTREEKEAPKPDRSTRPENQDLLFDSFVIPLKQNEEFTYISLSISFKLPNIRLKREMIEKKDQLRGIVYSILEDEINRTKEVPSLEALKVFITGGVNKALVHGKVREVFITQFLVV